MINAAVLGLKCASTPTSFLSTGRTLWPLTVRRRPQGGGQFEKEEKGVRIICIAHTKANFRKMLRQNSLHVFGRLCNCQKQQINWRLFILYLNCYLKCTFKVVHRTKWADDSKTVIKLYSEWCQNIKSIGFINRPKAIFSPGILWSSHWVVPRWDRVVYSTSHKVAWGEK